MFFYLSAYKFNDSAYFGAGTGTIWLDNLVCSGSELTLLQCSHIGLGRHNCDHSEDVSVNCSGSMTGSLLMLKIVSNLFWYLYTGNCTNGDIRLYDGSSYKSELVEVCVNNIWGVICSSYWDYNDAKVVCHMLNYPSSSKYIHIIIVFITLLQMPLL